MEEDVYHNENLAFLFIYLFLRKMKEFKNQKYIHVRKYPMSKIYVTFPFILIVSIPDKTIIIVS
jgi:hypothetical protein